MKTERLPVQGPIHGPARAGLTRRNTLAAALLAAAGAAPAAPTGLAAWPGPVTGPRADAGRRIGVLAEDLRNGGVLGVAQGMREAARELKWTLRVFDAAGTPEGRRSALQAAMAQPHEGLAVLGSDAEGFDADCAALGLRPKHVVGWHVGASPGRLPRSLIATNITTDPLAVGRSAAAAVLPAPGEQSGVVVITDSRFGIATAKSRAMQDMLRELPRCTLLELLDVPISDSARRTPAVVRRLVQEHGRRWTHALAINDIYFDHAVPVLIALGDAARHVKLLSAGDGSASAMVRVRAGTYQVGTVAEPLNLQGWQVVDELNRLLAGQPVSSFVTPVTLLTRENIDQAADPALGFDPDIGYREAYRRIWFGGERR